MANYFALASALSSQKNRPLEQQDIDNARLLCRRVKRLDTLNEDVCNGSNTASCSEDTIDRYFTLVADLLAQYGIKDVVHNGDPRGYPVKMNSVPNPKHWQWRDMGGFYYLPFRTDLN